MPSTDDHMLADLRRQAESMTGAAGLPRRQDGEPVFDEPWQGRAVAVAVETVASMDASWDVFRDRLIAAISAEPERPYYESWLVALEQLVVESGLASGDDITHERLTAASYRTTEQEPDDLEVFPIPVGEELVLELLSRLFTDHWRRITFGPLLQGAAYALSATAPPRLALLDGYLTVDLGHSRLHLCIGEQKGLGGRPIAPDLARRRRCSYLELQRQWAEGAPRTWMVRLFNGDGDQMITVILPHPFLDDDRRILDDPDWSRLDVWDELRERYLALPPDPADRLADRFLHV